MAERRAAKFHGPRVLPRALAISEQTADDPPVYVWTGYGVEILTESQIVADVVAMIGGHGFNPECEGAGWYE